MNNQEKQQILFIFLVTLFGVIGVLFVPYLISLM